MASCEPVNIPSRPGAPLPRWCPPTEGGGASAAAFEAEVAAGIEWLLAYLAEPGSPLTIGELAAAAGVGPLAVGAAILKLRGRGRLAVVVLPGPRFELRPV